MSVLTPYVDKLHRVLQRQLEIAVSLLRETAVETNVRIEAEASDLETAVKEATQEFERLVFAVELVRKKAVELVPMIAGPADEGGVFTFFRPKKEYRGGPASVDLGDAPTLEAIVTILDTRATKRIETALLEFDTALKSAPEDPRRLFIHAVVALEALFGDDETEAAAYKVRLRATRFIPSLRGRPAEGLETFRKVYGIRSKFVHGTWDERTLREAGERADELLDLTAEAILEFLNRIRDSRPTSFPDLDTELLLS